MPYTPPTPPFNAARSHERALHFPAAITGYERYLRLAPKAADAPVVSQVVAALRRQAKAPDKPALAVLYFDYEGGDASLAGLRRGFAQMLTSDLSQPEAPYSVVERVRINALLEEQALVSKGIVAAKTGAQSGRLVGAKYLVLGAFFTFGGVVRVDARVVAVETGVTESVGVSGPPADMLKLERRLAAKIAARLSARLHPEYDRPEPPRTKAVPIETVASYGRALAHLDRGETKLARAALRALVGERPGLPGASQSLALASGIVQ